MTLRELRNLINAAADFLPPDAEALLAFSYNSALDKSTPKLDITYPGPVEGVTLCATVSLPELANYRGAVR